MSWYHRTLCEAADLERAPNVDALSPAEAQDLARGIFLGSGDSWLARAQHLRELAQRSLRAAPQAQFALSDGPASRAC